MNAIFYIFLCSGIATVFCSMMIDLIGRKMSFYVCFSMSMFGMIVGLLSQNVFFGVLGIICLFVCGSFMNITKYIKFEIIPMKVKYCLILPDSIYIREKITNTKYKLIVSLITSRLPFDRFLNNPI